MRWITPSGNGVMEGSNSHNSVAAVANLLTMMGVPYALGQLRTRIQTHPQFPSLPTLIDAFEEAGLTLQAVSGETDELADVTLPAIAHLQDEIFEAHRAWVASTHLDGIPAIFLNGKPLPREFSMNDLKIYLRTGTTGEGLAT